MIKSKKEMEDLIDEILDEEVDLSILGNSLNHFFNANEAERIILEEKGKDIQDEFKESIKKNPMVIDNMNKSLNGKTKNEIKEEVREENIREETKKVAAEEGLNEAQAEEINEKAKSDEVKTNSEIKAIAIKVIYEQTLDDYNRLREDLYTGYNGQVKTGELTNGKKMDTKLIMYQRYLRKLDMQYKGCTGYLIAADDEALKEKENKYFRREQKNEKLVYEEAEKNIDRVHELNVELSNIAEDINRISANSALMNPEEFKSVMDKLQNEYIEKTVELRNLNPNVVELIQDLDEKKKSDQLREKVVGQEYENLKYRKGLIDSKNASLDEVTDRQEEKIEKDITNENINNDINIISSIKEEEKIAEAEFARFEATGSIEAYNNAVTHLSTAKKMAGITCDITLAEDISTSTTTNDVKRVEKDDMGLSRTDDEKMAILKARFNEEKNELNEKINEMDEAQKDLNENILIRK